MPFFYTLISCLTIKKFQIVYTGWSGRPNKIWNDPWTGMPIHHLILMLFICSYHLKVGRFPVLVPFHSFDAQMLIRVMTEPKNSLLAQMKFQFSMDNVNFKKNLKINVIFFVGLSRILWRCSRRNCQSSVGAEGWRSRTAVYHRESAAGS